VSRRAGSLARCLLRAGAVAALTLLVTGATVAAGPSSARADDEPAPALARITITDITPALLRSGDDVSVTGRVTNLGSVPLAGPSVRLRAVGGRLGARVDVDQWLDGEDQREGFPLSPSDDLAAPIAPGRSERFTVTVPASSLGLGGADFGVYPVALDVRATPEGAERAQVAFVRSTVQWQPEKKEYAAQRLTWLVPLTGLLGTAPGPPTATEVAKALAPGQRLPRLLDAASAPGVAWAVDPLLLETLQRAATPSAATDRVSPPTSTSSPGSTSSPTTTKASGGGAADAAAREVVRSFLARMRLAAANREVVELPYADPDLQALSDAGAMSLGTAARAAGAGTITEVLGVTPRTDIAWPAGGEATDDLVRDLAAQHSSIVLDGASRPLVDALNYTPDARTTSLPGHPDAVLSDPQLSALAARASGRDAGARLRFLAETAAATTERPGLARRLLVTLPRSANPDPAGFRAVVAASSGVPWVGLTTLDSLLQPVGDRGDVSALPRRSVTRITARPRPLRGSDVELTLDLRSRLAALGEVVTDPVRTTAEQQHSALTLVSSAWRGNRTALTAAQAAATTGVRQLTDKVHVLPTTITFLRSKGRLQLTVSNDLDQRVEGIRLRVVAPSPRLVVTREVSRPLPALEPGTRASVRVPVRALASGQTVLQAQLLAPSGAPLGDLVQVRVRFRPTDSWVLSVGGVVIGLVVLVGLVRALRRPRRRAAVHDPAADELGETPEPSSDPANAEEETR